MISYESKNNSEKLSADSNQGLGLLHAPVKSTLIPFVQRTSLPDGAVSSQVQELAHKRLASFGDPELAFMFPRTHFIQIKPGKLHHLGDRAKLREVSYFSIERNNP